ncbi:hypothetical protein QQS21_002773 [Conoideocrella luteorostrata]|uniref:CREG-like beta-barrel domain-containing protein n=1 Tax=Conoideocrella luteorostrata TaxID=1105319 RepID=A0AAJ0CUG1_9HYPO|nr:hypothetical protein QQS21_002773 [Conoideocrella luteorostrata]
MKLLNTIAGLSGVVAGIQSPLSVLDNSAEAFKIPTSYESAVMGRRILALSKLGTLSTIFPNGSDRDANGQEVRPGGMEGQPIGLMDYVADCEDEGNPTILALTIGTSFKNVRAGSNITLSMRWIPPYPPTKRMSLVSRLSAYVPFRSRACPYNTPLEHPEIPDTVPYSAANLPRFSLFGYLERVHADADLASKMATCYTAKHPDARFWLPGNHIHESEWMRLVVTHVYWIGGFGDRAYIGWIPIEDWKMVKRQEWESIKLPGEKKRWSEWSIGQSDEL